MQIISIIVPIYNVEKYVININYWIIVLLLFINLMVE